MKKKNERDDRARHSASRREFFKKLGKGGVTALAYSALGGFIARDMTGRAVADGPRNQQCVSDWHWHCEKEYYQNARCGLNPIYSCESEFGCQTWVICNDVGGGYFTCGGDVNAYGCTVRKFDCENWFRCPVAGDQFNCDPSDFLCLNTYASC